MRSTRPIRCPIEPMLREIALAPIVIPQALWVAARAARLPEAAGPRAGQVGQGPLLRLLILGDSSAAGVGVAHQDQALAGQLSTDLARDHRVEWRLVARSGATVATALDMAAGLDDRGFDHALIALGVNDVKNGVWLGDWTRRYDALLGLLRERAQVRHIIVTGLPPIAHFPLLPSPLRDVLGARAEQFDAALQDVAARHGAAHLPVGPLDDPALMASDGFHPGPVVHAEWARRAAEVMRGLQGS